MTEANKTTCKDHTPQPNGYIAWHNWAEKKSKTHDQVRCGECGLLNIWIEKANLKGTNDDRN